MVGGSVVEAWWRGFRNSPGQKAIGPLQNDRERRDMMAAGAAAGLSAAFGAPVGKYVIFNLKYIQIQLFLFLVN